MANQTWVTEFFLLGFTELPAQYNMMIAFIMFMVYMVSCCANSAVISLISLKKILHQPMYFLMGLLSLSDLISDTATLPKMISRYWVDDGFISYPGCLLQMFFFHTFNVLDSIVIMLMSLDRYVAICKPLRYRVIFTTKFIFMLCFVAILFSASIGLYCTIYTLLLTYCGPNKIENIFCAAGYVMELSCVDFRKARQNISIVGIGVHMASLSFIAFSYTVIISKLCTTAKPVGWKKVFYTCSTHWLVIALYIIPRVAIYSYNGVQLIPKSDVNVLLMFLYTYIPHISSPIIFCLRMEEVKRIMGSVVKKITKPKQGLDTN